MLCPYFFWFAYEFFDGITHVSTWNSGKAFTFLSPKLEAMKVRWLTGYHILRSTSSGTVTCSLAIANRKEVWQMHPYRWSKHAQLVRYWLEQKNWFGNSVEGRSDHPFSTYVNCTPLRTGTEKQQIQVKIADIRKHSIPSRFVLSGCLQTFYVHFSKIWIVLTMSRLHITMSRFEQFWPSYSTFKKLSRMHALINESLTFCFLLCNKRFGQAPNLAQWSIRLVHII